MSPKPGFSACRRMPTASISSMKTMHWPPHLRARRFARRARMRTTIASMPMKVAAKPEPGDRDERRVEAGRERLRQHRLPGARSSEEEEPALTLAAGTLERLAGLPDRDDAADFLLRLRLSADVGELDAPLSVSGLEGLDLREVHDQQRAEEDREVHEHVEGEDQEERQDLNEVADAADQVEEDADDDRDDRDLQPEAPEPHATARDDVLLAQLLALEPEEARPRDETVEDEVERRRGSRRRRGALRGSTSTRPSPASG